MTDIIFRGALLILVSACLGGCADIATAGALGAMNVNAHIKERSARYSFAGLGDGIAWLGTARKAAADDGAVTRFDDDALILVWQRDGISLALTIDQHDGRFAGFAISRPEVPMDTIFGDPVRSAPPRFLDKLRALSGPQVDFSWETAKDNPA
jgi:hypothetical protein